NSPSPARIAASWRQHVRLRPARHEFVRLRQRLHNGNFANRMGHHPLNPEHLALTRREFLSRCGMGMGALSAASLFVGLNFLNAEPATAPAGFINPLTPKSPHFPRT